MSCTDKIKHLFERYVPSTKQWDVTAMTYNYWHEWLGMRCSYRANGVKISYDADSYHLNGDNIATREHAYVEVDNNVVLNSERRDFPPSSSR